MVAYPATLELYEVWCDCCWRRGRTIGSGCSREEGIGKAMLSSLHDAKVVLDEVDVVVVAPGGRVMATTTVVTMVSTAW